jgi:hypothetical protein
MTLSSQGMDMSGARVVNSGYGDNVGSPQGSVAGPLEDGWYVDDREEELQEILAVGGAIKRLPRRS